MSRALLLFVVVGKSLALVGWCLGLPASVAALVFFGAGLPLVYAVFVPGAQGLGQVITRFSTSRREVWLTIDDGPDGMDTPRLLEVLAAEGAKATFFVVGERVERNRGLVERIVAEGHEVAHHTHTHPEATFWCAGPVRVRRELDQALAVLAASGARPRWFRAPVGIKNLFLFGALRERELRLVGWTIRSWDSVGRDPDNVVRTVMRRVQPGAIVLLHEGPRLHPAVRVEALERLVRALKAEGYACVIPPREAVV